MNKLEIVHIHTNKDKDTDLSLHSVIKINGVLLNSVTYISSDLSTNNKYYNVSLIILDAQEVKKLRKALTGASIELVEYVDVPAEYEIDFSGEVSIIHEFKHSALKWSDVL